jgi:hypothetical protein
MSHYDRERREREAEREHNYVSRADPRDRGEALDYGDSRPGSVRRRRESDAVSPGSKRDNKVRIVSKLSALFICKAKLRHSACVGLVLPLRHQLLRPRTLASDLAAKRVNSRRISSGYGPWFTRSVHSRYVLQFTRNSFRLSSLALSSLAVVDYPGSLYTSTLCVSTQNCGEDYLVGGFVFTPNLTSGENYLAG